MRKTKVWLLVGDDIFSVGLKLCLAQWGLEVVEHPCPKATTPSLTGQEEPDLIILDYKTSFDPSETLLLTSGHSIPILFLVAHPQALATLSQHVQLVHYYGCLPKPCPIRALQKAIEGLLGIRLEQEAALEEVVPPFCVPLPQGSNKQGGNRQALTKP